MGATNMYALPWPELPDAANDPEGFGKLPAKVDDQMTRPRSDDSKWVDIGLTLKTGEEKTVWSNAYNAIKGWMEKSPFGGFPPSV